MYLVTPKDFINRQAKRLLELNNNSLYQLLCTVYPEHPWEVSKFDQLPSGYWKDFNNQRNFLDKIAGYKILPNFLNVPRKA